MSTATLTRTKWAFDKAHSEIQFKAKHLMISTVTGTFSDFDAIIETEGDDFTTAKVEFKAAINSLNTGNEQRDTHLKSADFFKADEFPEMKFVSTTISKKSDDEFVMNGNLSIRGTTLPVSLNVEFGGIAKDPWGNTKAGATVTGKVNRKDFGLMWNVLTEAGGMLVSEEIKIHCSVQLTKA